MLQNIFETRTQIEPYAKKFNCWPNGNCSTFGWVLAEKATVKAAAAVKPTEKDKSSLQYNILCKIPPDVLHTRKSILDLVWKDISNVVS